MKLPCRPESQSLGGSSATRLISTSASECSSVTPTPVQAGVWLSNELVANLDERFSLTLQPNVIGRHRRDVAPGRSRCLQRDGEVLERHANLRLGIVRQQSLGRRPDFPET